MFSLSFNWFAAVVASVLAHMCAFRPSGDRRRLALGNRRSGADSPANRLLAEVVPDGDYALLGNLERRFLKRVSVDKKHREVGQFDYTGRKCRKPVVPEVKLSEFGQFAYLGRQ